MEKASSEEILVNALIEGWESAGISSPNIVGLLKQMIGPIETAHHSLTADWMAAERRDDTFDTICIANEMEHVGRLERALEAALIHRT